MGGGVHTIIQDTRAMSPHMLGCTDNRMGCKMELAMNS